MQIIQLNELINIINDIIPETEETLFDEISIINFTETVLEIMNQYVNDYPSFISEIHFHDDFKEYIIELMSIPFELEFFWNVNLKEEMELVIDDILEIFFTCCIPWRSYSTSLILNDVDKVFVKKQIEYLRSKPQPVQRTKEWYEFRNNLITASNAYKAFENENTQNQLIYEKCNVKQFINPDNDIDININNENEIINSNSFVNINTTLHWGQKYEKVSVMIYEYLYNTIIEDFGCIKHDIFHFLGASPDGINIDINSKRYGRMLEIKNIINREIDGIPKKEYWIQMQLQMEVCNLDECDFLETKFIEFDNYHEYINFKQESINKYNNENDKVTFNNEEKINYDKNIETGIIMYFANVDGTPFYIYKPINLVEIEKIEQWEEENIQKQSLLNRTWIKNNYWKLEKLSCVLVPRNKQWFCDNINKIEKIWKIIENERINGFEHRAPNKRSKKDLNINSNNNNNNLECFIHLNKEDNKITILNKNDNITTDIKTILIQENIDKFFNN